jgi:hypothetical protein
LPSRPTSIRLKDSGLNLKEVTSYKYLKIRNFRLFDGVRTWLIRSVGRRNAVTGAFGAGPWVKASRIVVRITLLRSFICHKLSVRPNEVVGFCDFGTLHHSREF